MRRVHGIGVAVMMSVVLLLSGCAGPAAERDSLHDSSRSDSSTTELQGEKLASSLSDYIDVLIETQPADIPMDESQKDMLERAKANGGTLSSGDYETAWSNFKQCMVQLGYATPTVIQYSNGIYVKPVTNVEGMSQEQIDKLSEDNSHCSFTYLNAVNAAYKLQVGNPSLEQNSYQAAVDCLRHEQLIGASYTAEQLQDAFSRGMGHNDDSELDVSNPSVASCLAANGITVNDNTKAWKPFG